MLQNTSKTLGFKKSMVYKTPPGVGKLYLAHGLLAFHGYKFLCLYKCPSVRVHNGVLGLGFAFHAEVVGSTPFEAKVQLLLSI